MFRSVFRPYGPVWIFLNRVTDVLGLSLLWCFCSLPLITAGAATAALYDAAVHGVRRQEGDTYKRFFRTFRENFKVTALSTLFLGGILLFGAFVLSLLNMAAEESTQAALMSGAYRMLMLVPLTALCWSCILISRFTFRFRELTGAALQFLLQHPFASAAIGILTWVAGWFCGRYLLSLLFLPAVTAVGWSLIAEPIFRKLGAGLEPAQKDEESASKGTE